MGFKFWNFWKPKLSKMTSNVNGTSIMIHMRLTVCRLDTCATSGRSYVRFYSVINSIKHICIILFDFFLLLCRLNYLWIRRWWRLIIDNFRYWNICKLIDWYFWTFLYRKPFCGIWKIPCVYTKGHNFSMAEVPLNGRF